MNSKKIQHELRVFATSQEIIDVTMNTTDDHIVAQWKTTQNNRPTEQLGYQPNVQSAPTVPFSPVTQQLNQQLAIPQGYWNPALTTQQQVVLVYATAPQQLQQRKQYSNNVLCCN